MYTAGHWLKDDQQRTLLLRGINLGGSSKLPTQPNGATHLREGFFDHRNVSFVGRPFPLEEADEHFGRLKHWGMTFVRFLVPWEAVEHTAPGNYDDAYLGYLHAVLEKAHEYGIQVFIDPHQDVWSRWTGGSGAPGWTLEAVGMRLEHMDAVGAAITHQNSDEYRRMIWLTNFYKFGAATMFTLFFAGEDLAPNTVIDGVNAQTYLQTHYINAMRHVAERLRDLPNVVGFDTMNEPTSGYIGYKDLTSDEPHGILALGPSPTPLESMALAAGHPMEVSHYEIMPWGNQRTESEWLNTEGVRLWRDDCPGVWRENGVWTDEGGEIVALKPHHFSHMGEHPINFVVDYLKPFFHRYIEAIRSVKREHLIFIEGVPNTTHPTWTDDDPDQIVYAGHWYDNSTLYLKAFNRFFTFEATTDNFRFVLGTDNIQEMFQRQLEKLKQSASLYMDDIPVLVGEFGLPMDLNNEGAYRSGDFSAQVNALDMYYDAMDANLLNCTLWNYTADNTNEHGDNWNGEDLSIFSRDQQNNPDDVNSGGRALEAVVRPYPMATAGEPVAMRFNRQRKVFRYVWKPDRTLDAPTVIYVPKFQYPHEYMVEGDVGLVFEPRPDEQLLYIRLTESFDLDMATIIIALD